jgi:TPP-dependent pyruvate/acetoin dehydrogenase alpha subunit
MLEQMLLIRAFDSQLPSFYTQGLIRGSAHASLGQNAVAVGASSALRPHDDITSTHRGHGHMIAKGDDVKGMMAELLGQLTSTAAARGAACTSPTSRSACSARTGS